MGGKRQAGMAMMVRPWLETEDQSQMGTAAYEGFYEDLAR
jgi:hypothetical protein